MFRKRKLPQKVFERLNKTGSDTVLKIEGKNVFYIPSNLKTINVNRDGFCKTIEWFCKTHNCTFEQLQKLAA